MFLRVRKLSRTSAEILIIHPFWLTRRYAEAVVNVFADYCSQALQR